MNHDEIRLIANRARSEHDGLDDFSDQEIAEAYASKYLSDLYPQSKNPIANKFRTWRHQKQLEATTAEAAVHAKRRDIFRKVHEERQAGEYADIYHEARMVEKMRAEELALAAYPVQLEGVEIAKMLQRVAASLNLDVATYLQMRIKQQESDIRVQEDRLLKENLSDHEARLARNRLAEEKYKQQLNLEYLKNAREITDGMDRRLSGIDDIKGALNEGPAPGSDSGAVPEEDS